MQKDLKTKDYYMNNISNSERGIALLVTIFILALCSIIIINLTSKVYLESRISKSYTDELVSDNMLFSSVNLAKVLLSDTALKISLAGPQAADSKYIWPGQLWNQLATAETLPVEGFIGDPKIQIIDDDGLLNINSLLGADGTPTAPSSSDFYKTSLSNLFDRLAFEAQSYRPEDYKTRGNVAFNSKTQVAVIHDFIDTDDQPHNSPGFSAQGIEGKNSNGLFLNRPLKSETELLLVPGITVERFNRAMPFINVDTGNAFDDKKININTAPPEVLTSIGFTDTQVESIINQRNLLPLDEEIQNKLTEGSKLLKSNTKLSSNNFSIFAKIQTATTVRWLRAKLERKSNNANQKIKVSAVDIF